MLAIRSAFLTPQVDAKKIIHTSLFLRIMLQAASKLTATSSFTPSSSSRLKASDVCGPAWKVAVMKWEDMQAAGKVFALNGFVTSVNTNEKFGSASATLSLAVLNDDWKMFASEYFQPIADLPSDMMAAGMTTFRIPVKPYSAEYVQLNLKAFPLVLGDPEGWRNNPLVSVVFTATVYAPFGDITVPGISFKLGHISKVTV